jgi:urea transport system ATP-binding protein
MRGYSISIWEDERVLKVFNAKGGYRSAQIIRDVTLEVGDSEMVALLGRNGVGKSTLMKYIMGLVRATGGKVQLGDSVLPKSPARRARAGLGYVPQGRHVFPRLTVAENIGVAAAACGNDRVVVVREILAKFPILAARPNLLAGSLSGGQQQILSIARALATNAKVLLLDEPTEGVQPSIVDEIEGILKALNREHGISMLIAEQNLDFAASVASRAYVMDKGTIVHSTSRDELLQDKQLLHELLGV